MVPNSLKDKKILKYLLVIYFKSKWFFFVEYLSENMEFLPQNGAFAIHSDAPHTNLPHSVVAWVGPPHVVDTPIKKTTESK